MIMVILVIILCKYTYESALSRQAITNDLKSNRSNIQQSVIFNSLVQIQDEATITMINV